MTRNWDFEAVAGKVLALSPPPGEMPKAEGDALAVYFAMNISRGLGDIYRSGSIASVTRYTARSGHHRVWQEKHSISFG